jgi:hypothetical protein
MFELQKSMQQQIRTCDSEGMERSLRAMLAHVPYQLHIEQEAYYHSLLLVWLYFMGFTVLGEVSTNTGRIDAVWQLPDIRVIAEVKFHAERPLETLLDEASAQIHNKKYYEAWTSENKKIILISLAFSGKEVGCRMEELKITNRQKKDTE